MDSWTRQACKERVQDTSDGGKFYHLVSFMDALTNTVLQIRKSCCVNVRGIPSTPLNRPGIVQ